jgi:hypothetical protein
MVEGIDRLRLDDGRSVDFRGSKSTRDDPAASPSWSIISRHFAAIIFVATPRSIPSKFFLDCPLIPLQTQLINCSLNT